MQSLFLLNSQPRPAFGARPAILAGVASVAVTGLIAAAGLWPPATSAAAAPPAVAEAAGGQVLAVAAAPSPSRAVLTALLGPDLRWGAKVPVPFGCDLAAPVSAAEAGAVTAAVFGAGTGAAVMDQVARCGTRTTVAGVRAITIKLPDGRLTAWTRGDVLVTIATPGAPRQAATDLDAALVSDLTPVCPELAPTTDDARRNPANAQYAAFTYSKTVTATALTGAPDVGVSAVAGPAKVKVASMPAGVAGPPLPDPTPVPVAPSWPGPQVLTREVEVPAADQTGPGCGWSFTGQVPPNSDAGGLTAAAAKITATARAELVAAQAAWLGAAQGYPAALDTYTTALAGWTAYAGSAAQVQSSWAKQASQLATYQDALAASSAQARDRDAFLAAQTAARVVFAAQVAVCAADPADELNPDAETVPDPTSTPTPEPLCPPVRPAVLDQVAPAVVPAPAPPVLWTPAS